MWRSRGTTIMVYLDDGLGASSNEIACKIVSLQVHSDLLRFGFLPNERKCHWNPTQSILYLKTNIDTFTCVISATARRINSLLSDLSALQSTDCGYVQARSLASTCGKIISLTKCVGKVTRLMTRHLFSVINSRLSWYSPVLLTPDCLSEIQFWNSNVQRLNGVPICPVQSKPSRVVYSDASSSGCGTIIELDGKVFQQNWSDEEKSQSSTYRELKAVLLSLSAFQAELKSQLVLWYTDNQNVVSLFAIGSKVPSLHEMVLSLHEICLRNAITLDMQWIPRDHNSTADDISHIIEYDDYCLHVFRDPDLMWGPHNFDRLACHYNAKLPLFNTKHFQPGSSGVNAFSHDWPYHNNWLCPPVYLTCKVLDHLRVCKAQGTLIVPKWKLAHFWPIICSDGIHFNSFVVDWAVLPDIPNLFIRGKAKNSIFGSRPLPFQVLALRIDFQ